MKRAGSYLVASYLLVSSGCRHHALPPALSPPAVSAREDALPAPPLSSVVISLSVPLSALQELVQERLVIPAASDWRQVTGEGDSPEVAIRYEAQAGALSLAAEGPVVRMTLPIHYFGSFRARAKTPFGWIWLTHNTRWGSRERPGTIALRVASQLSLSPSWQLSSQSVLEDVVLTAPDVDKLCAGKVFKVCVPIELARDRVHAELEQQVRARAASELGELDAQVLARADLQGLAERVWERLQTVRRTARAHSLSLAPEAMTLSYPALRGAELTVELNVWGRPSFSAAPQSEVRPLPDAQLASAKNELSFAVPISHEALGQRLTAALDPKPNEQGYRVSELLLLGPALAPGRFLWAATLSSDEDKAVLYGESTLRLTGSSLSLSDVQPVSGAEPLLAATGFRLEQLTEALSRPVDLSPELSQPLDDLRELLADGVRPWPVSPLQGVTSTLQAAYATREGLLVTVLAR